jgi:lysophospholipase L1-like esterase
LNKLAPVTALTIALLTAGCGSGEGQKVFVIGDSITALEAQELSAQISGAYALDTFGKWGARIDEQIPTAKLVAEGRIQIVVINLGTNDAIQEHDTAASLASMRQMLDLFPASTCIVLVNINERMITGAGKNVTAPAKALNAGFSELAKEYPNVELLDWAKVVEKHLPVTSVAPDTVHPMGPGMRLLVDAEVAAIRDC